MKKSFIVKTLGCRVNQCESEAIEEQLKGAGYLPSGRDATADICIVNTCAVTSRACMQSRQLVRQMRRAHPNAQLVVTGCYTQIAPRDLAQLAGVDLVVDQDHKPALTQLIDSRRPTAGHTAVQGTVRHAFVPMGPALQGPRKRPFVKIQDGCSAFCTYCIVPYARGPSRSAPPEEALSQIERLHRAGYHEAVLTGIHLGWYGLDLNPPTSLLALLGRIRRSGSIGRVRLSSIEPCELTDDIIAFIQQAGDGPGRFCPHFHIPLQSGDDDILAKMGRPYGRDRFAERVAAIHRAMPDAAIGADVLVGFPGESDAAFENTRALLASLPVSYLHVFPFSPRPGTPAADMPAQVPAALIKSRCRRIRALGAQKRAAFHRRFVGRRLETLIERPSRQIDGGLSGTAENYVPVTVTGGPDLINALVEVTVASADANGVFGRVRPG